MKTHVRPLFKQGVLAEVRVRPRLQLGGLLPALRPHPAGISAVEANLHTLIDLAKSIVLPHTRSRRRHGISKHAALENVTAKATNLTLKAKKASKEVRA